MRFLPNAPGWWWGRRRSTEAGDPGWGWWEVVADDGFDGLLVCTGWRGPANRRWCAYEPLSLFAWDAQVTPIPFRSTGRDEGRPDA